MPILRLLERPLRDRAAILADADIILSVTGPDPASLGRGKTRRLAARRARPGAARRRHRRLSRRRARPAGDGAAAAHHARPIDGHPVVAVQPRRLQGGGRCGGGLWPGLSDDDDRGGDGQPGQIVRHGGRALPGCRRSPPGGGSARRSARPTSARRRASRSCRSAPSRSSSRMSPGSRARGRAAMPAR